MEFKNIFKKKEKTVKIANVEKLEKKQLEKVIGGVDTDITLPEDLSLVRPGHHKPGNLPIPK
jgi:hypothetical protein